MRRVLFVDHETRLSGAERNLADLVAALDPSDVDAHVALPAAGGPLEDALAAAGATVHPFPLDGGLARVSRWDLARRPWAALPHARAVGAAVAGVARVVRAVRPDVVHSTSQKAHLLAAPAARRADVPHVWHVQDILSPGWLATGVTLAARSAARVVCLSEATAAPFRGTAVDGRVRVVYPGVATRPVSTAEATTARRLLGATGEEPVVGIVGQVAWWKGQDVVVEAAARLPGVRVAVVGDCLFPANEAAYADRVRRRAAELGVTWVGRVEPVEPVMAALDVLVHASRLPEPFGRVLVEAMAQGTPVVTTTAGAGAEVVPPEVGVVVPPDDPVAVADAVGLLLADRAGRAEAARAAAARFAPDAAAGRVRAVWDEVAR